MLLCQEINEVHYTHHIFHAAVRHAYCLHKNTALFRKEKKNRVSCYKIFLFKAAIPWRLNFRKKMIFHGLQRKICFSKCRQQLNQIYNFI